MPLEMWTAGSNFPTLKIIVGHPGERHPSDLFRTDEQPLHQVSLGIPMQRNASSYWLMDLYDSTTAQNFATPLLRFRNSHIGSDRIFHFIVYPFALISEEQEWVDSLADVLIREELLERKKEGGLFLRGGKVDGDVDHQTVTTPASEPEYLVGSVRIANSGNGNREGTRP
ncbi:uncharacterized protein ARMOST_20865 [Armillaria ostoyae]|uniref:Uncharacterized protein n=1 Tax=Armillaria ostoyae TaxID=47428 RepID=A0A284S8M3_ARMOS|nr:uncharacterized protein ARMOST_20865 [Armillaria ostoyae]